MECLSGVCHEIVRFKWAPIGLIILLIINGRKIYESTRCSGSYGVKMVIFRKFFDPLRFRRLYNWKLGMRMVNFSIFKRQHVRILPTSFFTIGAHEFTFYDHGYPRVFLPRTPTSFPFFPPRIATSFFPSNDKRKNPFPFSTTNHQRTSSYRVETLKARA